MKAAITTILLTLLVLGGCTQEKNEISSDEKVYLRLIFDGQDKDYIENHFVNILKPKEACNLVTEYYNPGYEAYSSSEGKVYWDNAIIVKDIFKAFYAYFTNKYVREINFDKVRWRFFPKNMEDIQFSRSTKHFRDNKKYANERIAVTCNVIQKSEYSLTVDVDMEYYNDCTRYGDSSSAYFDFNRSSETIYISHEEFAYKDYRWDGENWFRFIQDKYLSPSKRTCSS